MTLSELIDQLTDLQQEYEDRDPTVMIAYQPNWPLQSAISSVTILDPVKVFMDECGSAPDHYDDDPTWQEAYDDAQTAGKTVYIAEGRGDNNGYLYTGVAELLGWS